MHAKQLTLLSALAGLSLAIGACGSDSLTLPSEGEAARIEVVGETDNQQGRVGYELNERLAVRVTDGNGRPVIGMPVKFSVGGGGSAAPDSAITADSGIARTSITLGPSTGQVTGRAWIPVDEDQTPVETSFTATALAADANGIVIVDGDEQIGAVGTVLRPLVVRVTDAFGNPIPGVTVEWNAVGGGSVSAASTVTEVNGETSVERTLGSAAGPQSTTASAGTSTAPLAGSPVVFNHTATAGSAARVIVVDGNGQEAAPGATLPEPLVVQVLDAENNPIVNRPVTWVVGAGEGSVSPTTSNTDGQGRASTQWTLGPESGRNTVSAVVSGVGIGAFTATARVQKTSSSTSITAHAPEPSVTGQPVEVRVQVSSSGGTPTGTVNVTGEGASAPCTITLSNGTGACSLTFTEAGQQRITATYSGDSQFNGSDASENHRVTGPPNLPPVATGDAYSTNEDEALSVPAPGVLANDADLDGNPLTAIKDSDPSHGTLTLNSDGSFTYTPAADFSGNASFTYHASDGSGVSAPVTVTITVNAVNDAPVAQNDGPYLASAGEALFVDAAAGVLANDRDPDGNPMTAQIVSQATQGTVALNLDGSFSYTPAGASGTADSFTYSVSDGTAVSGTATVSVNTQ